MTEPEEICHDPSVVFEKACQLEGSERQAYLDRTCHGNPRLRANIESMLDAHANQGEFLADPTVDVKPCGLAPLGSMIGPYKLLQQIGEGGMGVVYMAEQTAPVSRRVAVKIIKPGMDSKQVVARFEAERQALAMMDHPNIAKVLDAGTTGEGHPYFVMELVKGVPISEYCDRHHLTIQERLTLFAPVCQAIQHAHQKGIIHRDIKPSNILIARFDGMPVAKIIDFGVAKAIGQKLTEKTMFTRFGQIVGTFEYMSPEQTEFNQLDIDTRSDIYSLGVTLYELLTGETPFDKTRLYSAAMDELFRIIREEDPPAPSTRLSTSKELPSVALNRKADPKKLSTLIRGELDWIVMKAMEKDRTRRYETATSLYADIEHYLSGDPVEACPPSATYLARKFVSRYRALLTSILLIICSLLVGCVVSATLFVRERQLVKALQEKEQQLWHITLAVAEEYEGDWKHERAEAIYRRLLETDTLLGDDSGSGRLRATIGLATAMVSQGHVGEGVSVAEQLVTTSTLQTSFVATDATECTASIEHFFDVLAQEVIRRDLIRDDIRTAGAFAQRVLVWSDQEQLQIPGAWFLLGWSQYYDHEFAKCQHSLDQTFRSGGDSLQLWLLMAMTYASLDNEQDSERARRWYIAARDRERKTYLPANMAWHRPWYVLRKMADPLFPEHGNTVNALSNEKFHSLFADLLREYPDSAWLHNRCGGYLARCEDWQNALSHYEAATCCNPEYQRHWMARGVTCLKLGDNAGYMETCRGAFDHIQNWNELPDSVILCLLTDKLPISLDRLSDRAEEIYTQRLHNRSGRQYLAKGLYDYRSGNYADAIENLAVAYGANARGGVAKAFLAMAYFRAGDSEKALAALEDAHQLALSTVPDPATAKIASWEEEAPVMRVILDVVLAEADGVVKNEASQQ